MLQAFALIHILAAIVWVGGLLFFALVAVPATRSMPAAERARVFGVLGLRFRLVGWAAMAVLVVTGIPLVALRGITVDAVLTGALFASLWGQTLMLKVSCVVGMIAVTAWHDLVVGPASTQAALGDPSAPHLRRQSSVSARAGAILAPVAVALAVLLVRGWPG